MNTNHMTQKIGFSVIEVILAAALFVILSVGAIVAVTQGGLSNRLGEEQAIATQYASEGIEAARSIKNQNFSNLINSAGTGIVRAGSVWSFSGSNNVFNSAYTRVLTVSDTQRDVNGNIVASGGTVDPLTKKITSTVSWNASPTRNNSVILTTYLTNWRKAIIGDWTTPSQQSSLDLAGNGNGAKIDVSGNYAYVVRTVGSPNFYTINISTLISPSIAGSINFGNTPTNIAVSGNYAYVSSRDNAAELQVVNISNPATPIIVGTFDAPGNADANAVFVSGNYAYLVRDSSQNPNFHIINISNPASPSIVASLSLAGNLQDISVVGSYAEIASANNGSELILVNVNNPASPSQVGNLNLAGNANALSILGYSNTVFLGRVGGEVSVLSISTPSAPSLLGTFNAGGDVNDMSIGNNNTYLFLATANSAAEFQVLNVSSPASITTVGIINMSSIQNGIVYSQITDRAFIVGSNNNPEFAILQPN